MKRLLKIIVPCCLLPLSTALYADDSLRYVRDWISVPLHQEQRADSAIVHSGVKSGAELTIVQKDTGNGFTRVRTADGIEGWIASTYLIAEPTARMQLDQANSELTELRKTNARMEQEQANIPADQKLAAQQLTQLRSDNAQLSEQLQTLQRAPDNATQLAQDNIELKKNNAELLKQIATANTALSELQRAQNYTLFREGALAVIAGAFLTALIPRLKPKKRSEWI